MLKRINFTFFKFILVGAINTIIGTTIMFVFYNVCHFSYWISSASNYIVGGLISYGLNKKYTFKNTEKGIKSFIRFVINITICYILAYGIAKKIIYMGLNNFDMAIVLKDNIAMILGMVLYVLCNYVGQKVFVFGK